jgi:hypothetical protein
MPCCLTGAWFSFVSQWCLQKLLETNGFVKAEDFQTAMAINPFYVLATAVNSKIIEFFWFNPIHIVKYLWFHTAKTGTIGINAAFSAGMVEINAPSMFAYHAQV